MPPDATLVAHHFEALGTRCSVFTVGAPPARVLEADRWTRRTGARLTRFSKDSELARLNASAPGWCEIGEELESMLRESLRAYQVSGGLVNVAVLPSMLAIGYTRPFAQGLPAAAAAATAHAVPPLPTVLQVKRGAARVAAGSGIDLGGMAKGWMADRLIELLGPNSLANLGGDLMAVGGGPTGDGWPVEFAGRTLLLRDQGAATSSVRRRSWGDAHHLIDPRTGLSSNTGLEEVSVVAASGADAEIVAKTALLLGPDLAPVYCAANAMAWWLSP